MENGHLIPINCRLSEYENDVTTKLREVIIKHASDHIYSGQLIKLNRENQTAGTNERIRLAWPAFGTVSIIYKYKKISTISKDQGLHQCMFPVTYVTQVLRFTKTNTDKIVEAQ